MTKIYKPVFVCLVFDVESTERLQTLRSLVGLGTFNTDVPTYRPHITLTGSRDDGSRDLRTKVERTVAIEDIRQFDVSVYKFGHYPNTSVFSLIPDGIGTLRWLNSELRRNILPVSASFEPENWKPHITLVKGLQNKEQRNAAVRSIAPNFEPFHIQAVGIGIKERGKHEDTYIIPFGV